MHSSRDFNKRESLTFICLLIIMHSKIIQIQDKKNTTGPTGYYNSTSFQVICTFIQKNSAKLLLHPSKLDMETPSFSLLCGVLDVQVLAGGVDVLVSPSTAVHHHPHTVWQGRAELLKVGERVGGLQGRDDALQTRYTLESCM
jgi:hypothetical protein